MASELDSCADELRMPARVSDDATLVSGSYAEQGQAEDAGGLDFGERYEAEALIGRGGMGEVRRCLDRRIGRKVALKVIRATRAGRPRSRARFVREAEIQGRLAHPAVVPVHDLAETPDGRPYFVMREVGGSTLDTLIVGLRRGDSEITAGYSRRRLLDAFSRVCLAMQYVHECGLVHRDLKPSNVMLGHFGEIYVLDWGLAKRLDAPDEPDGPEESSPTLDEITAETAAGELLGTPGYMAPEQLDGGDRPVDARADIYALGAILFEVLTWRPLHPRGSAQRAIGSTIQGADARCHLRAPDRNVPPELEAICVRATADDPAERYASARELHDAVQAVLDGDLDRELRREMARGWAERAATDAEAVLDGSGDDEQRRRALELAGRALALDPDHASARTTIMRLLLEPPRDVPPSARARLLEHERDAERIAARSGAIGFMAWLLFVPGVWALGVRDFPLLGVLVLCTCLGLLLSWLGGRSPAPERVLRPAAFLTAMAGLLVVGRMFGSLLLVPGLAATIAASYGMQAQGRARWFYAGTATAVMLVPLLLELAGVLPASYRFEHERIVVVPHLVHAPEHLTPAFLALATAAAILVPSMLLGRTRDRLRGAERRLALHAWQMEQMLPEDTRRMVDEETGASHTRP